MDGENDEDDEVTRVRLAKW